MLKHSEESYDVYKELSKSNDLEVKPPVNKKNKKIQMHQKKIMEILNKASKEEFFIQKSLFIFSLSNPLRRFCKFIITSDNYEIFRRIIIMINFVFLVFETIPKLEIIGRYSSYAFTLIYIVEFLIIIIARGFVLGNNTYLRSPWNFFDFLVVVFGVINFFPSLKGNILSLKLIQLTKPFNRNDKNGEKSFYFKLTIVFWIMILCYFFVILFLIIFSVIGLSFLNKKDIKYDGLHTGFANIGQSLFNNMIILFGEGGEKIMLAIMENYNYYFGFIYYIFAILINHYLIKYLIIFFLFIGFRALRKRDIVYEVNGDSLILHNKFKSKVDFNIKINVNADKFNHVTNVTKLIYHDNYPRINYLLINKFLSVKNFQFLFKVAILKRFKPETEYHKKNKCAFSVYCFYNQPIVQYLFHLCNIIHFVILALDRINLNEKEKKIYDIIDLILLGTFVIDCILNSISDGCLYLKNIFNILDFIIVFIAFLEKIIDKLFDIYKISSSFNVLSVICAFRIFKIYRKDEKFRIFADTIRTVTPPSFKIVWDLIIFILIYSLIGFQIFHKRINYKYYNFDTFPNSLVTCFILLVADHWDFYFNLYYSNEENKKVITHYNEYLFFITMILFGKFTLSQIYTSFVLECFQVFFFKKEKCLYVKNNLIYNTTKMIRKYKGLNANYELLNMSSTMINQKMKFTDKTSYYSYDTRISGKSHIYDSIPFTFASRNKIDFKNYSYITKKNKEKKRSKTQRNTLLYSITYNNISKNINIEDYVKSKNYKEILLGELFEEKLQEVRDEEDRLNQYIEDFDNFYSFDADRIINTEYQEDDGMNKSTINHDNENDNNKSFRSNKDSVKENNGNLNINNLYSNRGDKSNIDKSNLYSVVNDKSNNDKSKSNIDSNKNDKSNKDSSYIYPKLFGKKSSSKEDKYSEKSGNTPALNNNDIDNSKNIDSINLTINKIPDDDEFNFSIEKEPYTKYALLEREKNKDKNNENNDNGSNNDNINDKKDNNNDKNNDNNNENNISIINNSINKRKVNKKKPAKKLSTLNLKEINKTSTLNRKKTITSRNERHFISLDHGLENNMESTKRLNKEEEEEKNSNNNNAQNGSKKRITISSVLRASKLPRSNTVQKGSNKNNLLDNLKTVTTKEESSGKNNANKFTLSAFCLYCKQEHKLNQKMKLIEDSLIFDIVILILIVINTVTTSMNNQWLDKDSKKSKVLRIIDIILLIMFILEFLIKVIGRGLVVKKDSYLRKFNNYIDFFVLIIFFFVVCGRTDLCFLKISKIFCFMKPLRRILQIQLLDILIDSIFDSIPKIIMPCATFFVSLFMFSIFAIHFFKNNSYYYCVDKNNIDINLNNYDIHYIKDNGTSLKDICLNEYNGYWTFNFDHFSNFGSALKTNIEVALKENWSFIMKKTIEYSNTQWSVLYYIIFVLNILLVEKLIFSYMLNVYRTKEKNNYNKIDNKFQLTKAETNWVELQMHFMKYHPKNFIEYNNIVGKKIVSFSNSKMFKNLICLLIGLSVFVLFLQYKSQSEIMYKILVIISLVFTILFNIEILIKIISYQSRYFTEDIYNIMEIIIILGCDVIFVLNIFYLKGKYKNELFLSTLPIVLRVFRIPQYCFPELKFFHILKLILKNMFIILINMILILFIIIAFYANLGMRFFSNVPYRYFINKSNNYHDFVSSSLILFQSITGSEWTNVMDELAYHDCRNSTSEKYLEDIYCHYYNVTCYDKVTYDELLEGKYGCGNNFSYWYFISFLFITYIYLINYFLIIILYIYKKTFHSNEDKLHMNLINNLLNIWFKYDPSGTNKIKPYEFILLLKELNIPGGLNYDRHIIEGINDNINKKLTEFKKRNIKRKSILKENSSSFYSPEDENKNEYNSFYHNPDFTLYTNDVEVMKFVDKFDITTYSDEITDDLSQVKNVYIHYIRACIIVTKFVISKEYKIPFDKLDENKVIQHTKKMWQKEYKNIDNKFFEKNNNLSLSKILAVRLLLNIRKRLKRKKNTELSKKSSLKTSDKVNTTQENLKSIMENKDE